MSVAPRTIGLQIAERLVVPAATCPPALYLRLQTWAEERLAFDNPLYWQAREHRRPCRHIPRRIELFESTSERLVLPRGANRDLKKQLAEAAPDVEVRILDQRSAPPATEPLQLRVALRDYQVDAVERAARLRDGVLVAPTGSGKTVIAMGLIARLGLRALVLVHTRTLLEQTCAVVERCLGVQPGRLGGGHEELRDVTVATVQTLARRDLAELGRQFGLVLLDEAHHCPAATFTNVLQHLACRHRIGLTATPERADALHPLMYATLGPELWRARPGEMVDGGSLCAARVVPIETGFAGGRLVDRTRMIRRLCEDAGRNDEVVAAIAATRGRRALVLSERVEHCEELVRRLHAQGLPATLLVGKLSADVRQAALAGFRAAEAGVLVATSSLVGEGFDCPDLDTLYLVVPSGNTTRTTQALGRVLRPAADKGVPRVYDFVDALTPGLARSFRSRVAVYRRHAAQVEPARSLREVVDAAADTAISSARPVRSGPERA